MKIYKQQKQKKIIKNKGRQWKEQQSERNMKRIHVIQTTYK